MVSIAHRRTLAAREDTQQQRRVWPLILPTLQHGCTTGRHLWLCISVTLGLALGSQAAAAIRPFSCPAGPGNAPPSR